jgi:membrane peptidoglycan carboxypeptidase
LPLRPFSLFLLINRRKANQKKRPSTKQFWLGTAAFLCLLLMGAVIAAGLVYTNLSSDLPSLDTLPLLMDSQQGLLLQPTRLYDRTGQRLLLSLENPGITRHFLNTDLTSSNHFSPILIQTTISLIEPDFWASPGFDWLHLLQPSPSTIAEHVVNDLLLGNEPLDMRHSLRMRLLAAQITNRFGKAHVLEWYLNSLYFGHFAYGADNAARLYLNKSASDLSLSESTLLLAIAATPALNPIDSPAAALDRQHELLSDLLQKGVISRGDYTSSLENKPIFASPPIEPVQIARAFNALALRQVGASLPPRQIERGGLKIITTLDNDLQTQLACTLRAQLLHLEGQPTASESTSGPSCETALLLPSLPPTAQTLPPETQASAVVLDLASGEILGLSGDATASSESSALLNHNPGSLLTPFVALVGFERGLSPSTLVWDVPQGQSASSVDLSNPDHVFHGPMRLRSAVSNDFLNPLIQMLTQLGPSNVWKLSEPLGLRLSAAGSDPSKYLKSGSEMTLLDAARAYSTFANQGNLVGQPGMDHNISPNAVLKVQDWSGRVILDHTRSQSSPIISTQLAYLINHILSDENTRRVSMGYPNWLDTGRPAAAKIGQVDNQHDTWTVGYTPNRLVATWVGLSDPKSMAVLDYHASAGIWNALMQYSHHDLSPDGWEMPAGISTVEVCDPSGLLPTRYCPAIIKEIFLNGNEPTSYDNLYRTFSINRETGRLATVFTPLNMVDERVYLVPPPEAHDWAVSSGLPTPPTTYDDIQAPLMQPDATLTQPPLFAYLHGRVALQGSANGSQFNNYYLQVGRGLNPSSWQELGQQSNTPVSDGTLGQWNTTDFEDGLYALRLTVIEKDQTLKTAITQVTIDNTAPVLQVTNPRPGQQISSPSLNISADATDEVGISRIEWSIDGHLAGTTSQSPYVLIWPAESGSHTLVVKAIDLANNQTSSPEIKFTVYP